ncbi:MAG: DUF5986 family protein [Bacillus sp. (in: Bacteria)]|nr:DUF5986 family protein [Bacillus sp. (in: firmicutes)]
MQDDQFRIPLQDSRKLAMIEAVANAIGKNILEFIQEFDLATYNSIHMLKWDFTNTNLIKAFNGDGFNCFFAKRGPWKFVLIFDEINQYLYTLMKRNRLELIRDNIRTEKIHYLEALVLPNEGLVAQEESKRTFQMNLFDLDSNARNLALNEVLDDLTKAIGKQIQRYVLIAFENNKNILESASAIILTPNLEIAYEEEWSDLIPAYYDTTTIPSVTFGEEYEDGFEEIDIPIRKEVLPMDEETPNIPLRQEINDKKRFRGEES